MNGEKNDILEATVADNAVTENKSVQAEDASEEKRISKRLIAAIVGGVLIVMVLFVVLMYNPFHMQTVEKVQETLHIGNGEKYAESYIDITGRTAGEVAGEMGMEFNEFLTYYNLPEDMTEDVHEHAAINNIPAKTYAEKEWGMTFAAAKEMLGWGDDITGQTTIGEAISNTTLAKYFGEEKVETMKVLYNLDETVTGETLYGEVREEIESRMKAEREAEAAVSESEPTPAIIAEEVTPAAE